MYRMLLNYSLLNLLNPIQALCSDSAQTLCRLGGAV